VFALTRLRLPIAVIGAVVFAALLALAAFSSTAEANHSWSNYHWARTDKANLNVVDNLSTPASGANWRQHLNNTADNPSDTNNDWENPATIQNGYTFTDKLDLTIVGKGDSGYPTTGVSSPTDCKPIAGHVEVCNATYGSNGWLGLAQIWISSGHITAGTTKLNDTYFNNAKYNTNPWRNLVMCQEVGHDFGLSHTDENFSNTNLGSCMDYTNDPDGGGSYGADNQYPGGVANRRELRNNALPSHDYDQLASIYKHDDSTTTTGANSAGKLPAEASERAFNRLSELGERIHRSPDGRVEIYRRDLGDGNELISRVIRVIEEGTPVPEETTGGTETTGGNHDH